MTIDIGTTIEPSDQGMSVDLPWSRNYPIKLAVKVIWPFKVEYEGKTFYQTGKEGIRTKDQCPSAEFAKDGPATRVWLGLDGVITPE